MRTAGPLRLSPKFTVLDNHSEVFTVKFSPDGTLLACGCNDGAVRIYNVSTGTLSYTLNAGRPDLLPVTSLRFRPASATSKTKNVLLAVSELDARPSARVRARAHQLGSPDGGSLCRCGRHGAALACNVGQGPAHDRRAEEPAVLRGLPA